MSRHACIRCIEVTVEVINYVLWAGVGCLVLLAFAAPFVEYVYPTDWTCNAFDYSPQRLSEYSTSCKCRAFQYAKAPGEIWQRVWDPQDDGCPYSAVPKVDVDKVTIQCPRDDLPIDNGSPAGLIFESGNTDRVRYWQTLVHKDRLDELHTTVPPADEPKVTSGQDGKGEDYEGDTEFPDTDEHHWNLRSDAIPINAGKSFPAPIPPFDMDQILGEADVLFALSMKERIRTATADLAEMQRAIDLAYLGRDEKASTPSDPRAGACVTLGQDGQGEGGGKGGDVEINGVKITQNGCVEMEGPDGKPYRMNIKSGDGGHAYGGGKAGKGGSVVINGRRV